MLGVAASGGSGLSGGAGREGGGVGVISAGVGGGGGEGGEAGAAATKQSRDVLGGAVGPREWGERPGCGLWDTRVQVPEMEPFQEGQGQVFPGLWCGGCDSDEGEDGEGREGTREGTGEAPAVTARGLRRLEQGFWASRGE